MSRKIFFATACLLVTFVNAPTPLAGQDDASGFTLAERIQGSGSSLGLITKFDTAFGYRFNQYLAVEGGIPVYLINPSNSFSTATGGRVNSGIGDVFADVRLSLLNPLVNYSSILTVAAPTGDRAAGLSPGRATFDWSNLFDRTFSRVTPFVELGIADTIMDQPYFVRPFSSFGFISHFEGGASYKLVHKVSVGASLYGIEPSGQQRVYSKLVTGVPSPGSGYSRRHHGVFEIASVTVGNADITRDHGFAAWLGARPSRYADFEVGYSRSMEYALDSVFFGVNFNLGSLIPGHH